MFVVIGRAMSFGLPWAVMLAITVTMAFGIRVLVTNGVSTPARVLESAPTVIARPVGSDVGSGWSVYVGNNCWLPDPSGLMSCGTVGPGSDR